LRHTRTLVYGAIAGLFVTAIVLSGAVEGAAPIVQTTGYAAFSTEAASTNNTTATFENGLIVAVLGIILLFIVLAIFIVPAARKKG
jgi:hypothetical protein